MHYSRDAQFWEMGEYRNAHLSKLDLPNECIEKINNWWKNPQYFLVFLGNPGCGKSYLIAALIHAIRETNRIHFRYYHEKDFYSMLRQTIDKGFDYEYQIKTICETPMVFMDDINSTQATEFQKEALLSFVDQRSISGYPTVITSNLFFHQMAKEYHQRFVSRLKNKKNTIIELNWVDKRQYPEEDRSKTQ